jgi:hypothetical protein
MATLTKLPNGVMFDTTGLPGSGEKFAIKKFVPQNFPNILDVQLYTDSVAATDISGYTYILNLTGGENTFPITHVDSIDVESIEDLFNKIVAIL